METNLEVWLLHGALGSSEQFTDIAAAFLEQGYAVKNLEFPSHGKTSGSEVFRMVDLAEWLGTLLNQSISKPLLFGYSMGGYAALLKANSQKVRGVITLGTKFEWNPQIAEKETQMLDSERIMSKIPTFAEVLKNRHSAFGWENLLKATSAMMLDLGENPYLNHEILSEIDVPVLFALGDRDEMVSLDETVQAYRSTPKSALSVLPSTRHPIEKVDVSLLIWLVKEWGKLETKYPTIQKGG